MLTKKAMKNKNLFSILAFAALCLMGTSCQKYIFIDNDTFADKIMGAWAGKNIGVNFGRPTEFRWRGEMIPDSVDIVWTGHEVYDNWVALTGDDDVYMNISFVKTIQNMGFDAPADSFATAFAREKFNLWHANQQGRINVQAGIMPPMSGHWINNPHADDIDFEIESDFAGILSPAMPLTCTEICDKVGHIMNYGDGWYGGLFMAQMISKAFICDDLNAVIEESLDMIPPQSRYHQAMSDVIRWHKENPSDWKAAWQLVQENYSENFGCPAGCFDPFNIDAVTNSAYVLIGLLYGEEDIFKTMDIATRCGQDSDCNPASAICILGALKGYKGIGRKYTDGVDMINDCDYATTGYTIASLYETSISLAKDNIVRCGGKVTDKGVYIPVQKAKMVPFEKSFEGQRAASRQFVFKPIADVGTIEFDGTGICVLCRMPWNNSNDVEKVEVTLDGEVVSIEKLPLNYHDRHEDLFYRYGLDDGHHTLSLRHIEPKNDIEILKYIVFVNP